MTDSTRIGRPPSLLLLPLLLLAFLLASCGSDATTAEPADDAGASAAADAPPFTGADALLPEDCEGPSYLELRPTRLEFGNIGEGERPVHRLWFRNRGSQPLRILGVSESCTCTRTTMLRVQDGVETQLLPGDSIPPAGIGAIDVLIQSQGHVGTQRLQIELISDAERAPKISANLEGTILRLFGCEPRRLQGHLVANRGGRLSLDLRSLDGRPFELLGVDGAPPALSVHAAEPGARPQHRLHWDVAADQELGALEGELRLRLRDADQRDRVFALPMLITLGGALEIDPPSLDLGRWDPGSPTRATVIIRSHDEDLPLQIEELRCFSSRGEAVQVRLESSGPAEATVVLEISADCAPGTVSGSISLRTGVPGFPRTRIPFAGEAKLAPEPPPPVVAPPVEGQGSDGGIRIKQVKPPRRRSGGGPPPE